MLVDQGLEILDEGLCRKLLESQTVGRIAISISALPAILPVNYRMVDGAVVFLSGNGLKANAAIAGHVVGFEVDHLDPVRRTGWSVMMVGRAELISDGDREAMGDLGLMPWAGGAKANLVRIRPEFISGRRIPDSNDGL